ncbi:MAG TPA: hypothetical protein DCM58_07120 [Desulfovibrio sp.]|nr:hypothetical protein [Desulfovibrio sp.]
MAKDMKLNLGINTTDSFTTADGTVVSYRDIFEGILTNANYVAAHGGRRLTREDIQDLAQEAFLKAVMYHNSFKPELSAKPQDFGNRIAENCKMDAFHKVGRHNAKFTSLEVSDPDGDEYVPDTVAFYRSDEFGADRNLEIEELEDRVSEALDTLGEFQQMLVTMSLDGLKTGEIAKRLGLNPGNTYTRLCRAKKALRKALGTDFMDDFELCA